MKLKRLVFLFSLAVLVWPITGTHRSTVKAVSASDDDDVFQFVEVEAKCYRKGQEISESNPEERRWYISSVLVQPETVPTYSLIKQVYMPYFSRNVMDPVEARGIALDYGDGDMRLDGESSQANYATRAEAETARNEAIEYRKGQGGNIYSFEIDLNNPKGEATSKPKMIYRDKEQPSYEKGK
jgi:hypothetical protein